MQRFTCPLECRNIHRGGLLRMRNVRHYGDHLIKHEFTHPSVAVAGRSILNAAKQDGLPTATELAKFVEATYFPKGL